MPLGLPAPGRLGEKAGEAVYSKPRQQSNAMLTLLMTKSSTPLPRSSLGLRAWGLTQWWRVSAAPLLLLGLLAPCLTPPPAQADSFFIPPEVKNTSQTFGDIRIEQTVDGRNSGQNGDQNGGQYPGPYPAFSVSVYGKSPQGETLLARYPGEHVNRFYANPENTYFVGLSNTGIPGTAVLVLDATGRLIIRAHHTDMLLDYCDVSVSIVREWYQHEDPQVRFDPAPQGAFFLPPHITLRNCRGERVSLGETLLAAQARLHQYLSTHPPRR